MLCGHYDGSVEFAFRVGLPGNSGVGVVILAIEPGIESIAVLSPGIYVRGFSQLGTVSNLAASADGRTLQVTYRILATDGLWDAADNGTYTLSLQANQVADMSRNFAAAVTLGTFRVQVPTPTAATAVLAPTSTLTPLLSNADVLRLKDDALPTLA
jgi:hypothetical protein